MTYKLLSLGIDAISAHLTTDFWVMLAAHLIILKMMHTRISKKKKKLEKEKAELYVESLELQSKLEYYKRSFFNERGKNIELKNGQK